ncbi:CWF19-like protein 2 [Reticulomyxa filosa]|uniref:CWF19-like protein 2 n=1 Tax=Reticulomyxa filosa TaxID=46433 RepID=X6N2T0_RETFI|nr:CWF19-like protein 2 [Reticulomyxa filosa]|eukprot:ETO20044.1 CWF19-like protein 2 [Reticulomyxa filosa]
MPYFHVQFGVSGGGFAHLIEDEHKFPLHFGQEIIAGTLKLDFCKGQSEALPEQTKRADEFKQLYEPFQFEKLKQRMETIEQEKIKLQKEKDVEEEVPFSLEWMKAHNIATESSSNTQSTDKQPTNQSQNL